MRIKNRPRSNYAGTMLTRALNRKKSRKFGMF